MRITKTKKEAKAVKLIKEMQNIGDYNPAEICEIFLAAACGLSLQELTVHNSPIPVQTIFEYIAHFRERIGKDENIQKILKEQKIKLLYDPKE